MTELKSGRYVINPQGQKTGVLLSIKEYNELLEDLADLAIIAERKNEPTQPFDRVREKLEHKWLNTSSK